MPRFLLLACVLVSACASGDTAEPFRLDGAACLESFVPLLATADSARAAAAVDRLAMEAAEASMGETDVIDNERAQAELARICAERDGQSLDDILAEEP